MKGIGGDLGDLWNVTCKWTERVEDPTILNEDEIAQWIKRGSCRLFGDKKLTEYNKKYIEFFEDADLEFFKGHSLDSLRQTPVWKKMTPAAQAGLKSRFRKYLQRTNSIQYSTVSSNDDDDTASDQPPIVNVDDYAYPEYVPKFIRSFRGSLVEFEERLRRELRNLSGYWVHSQTSVSWISHNSASSGWGSCVDVFSYHKNIQDSSEIVNVTLYYNCAKVVVSGSDDSTSFRTAMKIVSRITDPDDGLYHRLILPNVTDYTFPLLDEDKLIDQRREYENRFM
jgi:hypothetical protein